MLNAMLFMAAIAAMPTFATSVQSNIDGVYTVKKGLHYPNKTSVVWGENDQKIFSVLVSLSESCATYNSSDSCDDEQWYYDFNKLWGKARCGYTNSHHDDSDRFTWRRCTSSACAGYDESLGKRVQIAAYSYDNGAKPYPDNPELLKVFNTLLIPNVMYMLTLEMDESGLSQYHLSDSDGDSIETQTVQHQNACAENYNEGTVHGLYFGGDCRAPEDVTIQYWSEYSSIPRT